MNDAYEFDTRRHSAPTEYDIAAVVLGHVASDANSSIVMQEHLPTMAKLQQPKTRLMTLWKTQGASLLQLKGQAEDKHWCFSVVLLLRQKWSICEHLRHKALIICHCKVHASLLVKTLWHATG